MQKQIIHSFFPVLFSIISLFGQQFPLTVIVKYPHYEPDSCKIEGNFISNWNKVPMEKISAGTFRFRADITAKNYLFNIQAFLPYKLNNGKFLDNWAAMYGGIRSAVITVNGTQLSNNYIVDAPNAPIEWANFSVSISSTEVKPGPGVHFPIDKRIPPEVIYRKSNIKNSMPPNGFKAVIPWMQAIHNDDIAQNSTVYIDWVRLYARINGRDTLLLSEDYAAPWSGNDGGLYIRHPWFPPGDEHTPMSAEVTGEGYLKFSPSNEKESVWHWWTPQRALIPSNSDCVFIKARVKIEGGGCISAGMDWWRELNGGNGGVDNAEVCVSNWYFDSTNEWDTVVAFSNNSTSIEVTNSKVSYEKVIFSAYPNPVPLGKKIHFICSEKLSGEAVISIYDVLGNSVYSCRKNISGYLNKRCPVEFFWDLKNNRGRFVSQGTYCAILKCIDKNNSVKLHKLIFGIRDGNNVY